MKVYAMLSEQAVPFLEAIHNCSTEDRALAIKAFGDTKNHSILTISGDSATIDVIGVLSASGPSPIARFFGYTGTAYQDIIQAAQVIDNDVNIQNVTVRFDTPGGTVSGMDQARQSLVELSKNKTVVAENHGLIASAGYYLASAIPTIKAMSPLAETGSIGVIVAGLDFTDALKKEGIKKIRIVSKNAPFKGGDPNTKDGLKSLQQQVDAVERVFISKIAQGRGLSEKFVIDNFGKGSVLIAQDPSSEKDALTSKMIDSVVTGETKKPIETKTIKSQEILTMDLNTLKAEHAALYAQVVDIGVKHERERVDAHIELGKASGAVELSMKCIAEGTEHTPASNAKYTAAQLTAKGVKDRKDESEPDLDINKKAGDNKDDPVALKLAANMGIEL